MNLKNIDYYVIMCKDAKELQENHKPEIGDYYYLHWLYDGNINSNRDINDFLVCEADDWQGDVFRPWADYGFPEQYESNIKNSTWLPRQDQLQDIYSCDFFRVMNVLYNSIYYSKIHSRTNFETMEELWLAIVMYHKYGTVWDANKITWVSP